MDRQRASEANPTIFHVTHWKAGSQWLHRILLDLNTQKIVPPELGERQFLKEPLVPGAIYPTVYVTKEQFESVPLPDEFRKFTVFRDLRDTLVSGYFSIRYSHAVIADTLVDWRSRLDNVTIEDGLLILLDEWLPSSARIQQSWVAAGEDFIRYEDLLDNDMEILQRVFVDLCGMSIEQDRLHAAIRNNRFESLTGGRLPGEEQVMAHERKGIAGDWRNHFTPRVKEEFHRRYGRLLRDTGYETSDSWMD